MDTPGHRYFALLCVLLTISCAYHAQSTIHSAIIQLNEAGGGQPPIVMKGAQYDPTRGLLPYFAITHTTSSSKVAKPQLVVKKTLPVDQNHASVIKKRFAAYLSGEFQVTGRSAYSREKNLNPHQIVPFRLSSTGDLEELVEYKVQWNEQESASMINARQSSSFASSSVLQSGTWYKIAVTQTGLHKLDRSFFSSIGINTSRLNPANIRIYGNGGSMVPELNGDSRIDDLHENPILVVDGNDGSFDNADYVVFYATGTTTWGKNNNSMLKHFPVRNRYTDTSFYYINVDLGPGKRIGTQPSSGSFNVSTSSYDFYAYHEQDLVNLAKSGRIWLGESFDFVDKHSWRLPAGNLVTGDTIMAEVWIAASSNNPTHFTIHGNGLLFTATTQSIIPNQYQDYATMDIASGKALNTDPNAIEINIERSSGRGSAWIDKVIVNARRKLILDGSQILFSDSRISAPGNTARYIIQSTVAGGAQLWNVSDPLNPFLQSYNITGNGLEFAAPSSTLNHYCLTQAGNFYTPTFVSKVANQNLHGIAQADYVIVTHPMFLTEAQRLGAFHEKQEGYTYCVATTEQIYNEFSSGKPDIAAIRDFIRMLYERNKATGKMPRFACLMGDGSYNNKSRNLVNNSNLIPTYQSEESFDQSASIASDDFFGMMDSTEGTNIGPNGYQFPDVGIGRFVCRTVSEMRGILNKIENYYTKQPNFTVEQTIPISHSTAQSTMGDWRTWIMVMADDGDHADHMRVADNLATLVKNRAPLYNAEKVMLDAYRRVSTPGGNRYPDASADFTKRISKGTLLINYVGHGGEVGLTAERMVDVQMINEFENFNQLPLFITATCEFSRYDDPNRTSAGELCLLNPKGGMISLITTCRLAFANTNEILNIRLMEALFTRDPVTKTYPTLGEAMYRAKTAVGSNWYAYAHVHLLGDPALTLAYPNYSVHTTSINHQPVDTSRTDTLKALQRVTVTGIITDLDGKKLDFNGVVWPTVFDKEQQVQGLLNDISSSTSSTDPVPFVFHTQKNILYRGKTVASHGNFSFTFLVPKDISFAPGRGKISYYATTGLDDAAGHYNNFMVGGESGNMIQDNIGPEITLFLNDKNFVSGGTTDENPILYADLIDSSGINTSGIGLGHDLSVILDEHSDKPIVLNDFYEANLNSYQSGRVRYPFNNLSEGRHTLTFKAWDIQNNSSTVALDFIVAKRADLALEQVLNYPNPFTSKTKFFFQHNQSGLPLKVHIQIYTVSGKLVKTIQQTVVSNGFMSDGIEWDGKDDYGDKLARGVYVYRLAILDINNKKAEKIEKLVILK